MLLASPKTNGPIAENSREKIEFLSQKIPLISLSYPRFALSPSPKQVGSTWSRELSSLATCPIAISSLDYILSSYPPTLDFHPMASCHVSTPLLWGATLLLASPKTNGPIAENSREKIEFLSQKIPLISLSYPRFALSPSPKQVGSTWSRELSSLATCPIAISSLDYILSSYPPTLDFHPMASCHVSTHVP